MPQIEIVRRKAMKLHGRKMHSGDLAEFVRLRRDGVVDRVEKNGDGRRIIDYARNGQSEILEISVPVKEIKISGAEGYPSIHWRRGLASVRALSEKSRGYKEINEVLMGRGL